MEEKDLQVEKWRVEFKAEKERLGRFWRSLLINSSSDFLGDEGRRTIETVSEGRGSLIRTVKVVNAMKKIGTPALLLLSEQTIVDSENLNRI